MIQRGDALDLLETYTARPALIVTDPPYAFGGAGVEHELSATVAIVLRECAHRLAPGGWMVVFTAASWRSTSYAVDAVRRVVTPVRIGTWVKGASTSKAKTSGWAWGSVNAVVFRKGKSTLPPSELKDFILADPVRDGRRAQLPRAVAEWAVKPFAVAGAPFLDPFAGSGVLVEVAAECGMDAVGFELQEA